ncbi:kexin [Malassezia yamatoensis]|uniref:Calnexin n=1 Tax=Malassezia yamatoensis TaxID=253288 RepID=A0AAJ6CFZ8_9BASI|nr:kexin [Malassezia yamatoensis]
MKSIQSISACAAALAVLANAPAPVVADSRPSFVPSSIKGLFVEQFTPDWDTRWAPSRSSKLQRGEEEFKYDGEWSVEEPTVFPGIKNDKGLVLKSKAKQHAISAKFDKPIEFDGSKPFIVQYEVKMQNGLSCGGAYIKLLSAGEGDIRAEEFSDKTPYTIMFGPDRCGTTNRIHFIFHHKNPVTGKSEEKHLKELVQARVSKTTILYTLQIDPDNSFKLSVDEEVRANGTLFDSFEPPVNPPKMIDDPYDSKPADWVDEAEIPDPKAKKPADWDEDAPSMILDPTAKKPSDWFEDQPLMVPDPTAEKPEEWDDEEDGEWVAPMVPNPICEDASGCGPWSAPMIQNPDFKGKWSAPLIPNPKYKGEWAPRKVPNEAYYYDEHPNHFTPIGGVGFELWSMDDGILFDNIYLGNDPEEARKFAQETFEVKLPLEKNSETEQIRKDPEFETGHRALPNIIERVIYQIKRKTHVMIERLRYEEDYMRVLRQNYVILGFWAALVAGVLGLIGLVGSLFGRKQPAPRVVQTNKKVETATAVPVVDSTEAKASGVQPATKVTKRAAAKEDVSPRHVADALQAEFVERVGALPNTWLLRRSKASSLIDRSIEDGVSSNEDFVLKRFRSLKQASAKHTKRCVDGSCVSDACIAETLDNVQRQTLRKREKRDTIYDPMTMRGIYPEIRSPIAVTEAWMRSGDANDKKRAPLLINATTKMRDTFHIQDPLFYKQWHLVNVDEPGNDIALGQVWQNATGRGVTVSLLDDGLDFRHPDLKANFDAKGSYDFNDHTPLPEPRLSDDQHGTRCAGEIAAVSNDMCGVGVAPDAHVSAVRILSGPITDADEAAALNYAYDTNAIYSCSWGPPDNGRSMDAPKGLVAKALLNGIYNGRGGNGSIYVFAGGNGGGSDDQCNFDGYTNSIYTVTIAAVDRHGHHPYYSEMCSAIIASSYSSGAGEAITTTDITHGQDHYCTSMHGGTSAAAPLVAGMLALVLQLRPELTWRDVQHILVAAAEPNHVEDPDWETNGIGRKYSHKYGYGIIRANKLLATAISHELQPPQAWLETPMEKNKAPTLKSDEPNSLTIRVTQDKTRKANVKSLEHVTVSVWIQHDRRGDIQVELFSPSGTRSVLASPRRYDDDPHGFPGWTFMSLKHWGENMVGDWRLQVSSHTDKAEKTPKTAAFAGWSLTLWGAAHDADKAVPWTFPKDSEEYSLTLSGAPESTVLHGPSRTATSTTQLHKPTKALPEDHHTLAGETHKAFGNAVQRPEADTGFLGSLNRQSMWIFVAGGAALVAGISLILYFYNRRRRMRRYEYLPTDENEIHMRSMATDMQARDLYDAFALDDDEDELEEDVHSKKSISSSTSNF